MYLLDSFCRIFCRWPPCTSHTASERTGAEVEGAVKRRIALEPHVLEPLNFLVMGVSRGKMPLESNGVGINSRRVHAESVVSAFQHPKYTTNFLGSQELIPLDRVCVSPTSIQRFVYYAHSCRVHNTGNENKTEK